MRRPRASRRELENWVVSQGFTRRAPPSDRAQPANSDRTTVPTDRRTSRQTTYSNGVVFMPSRIGVTTSTSAMQNSLCKDRKRERKRVRGGSNIVRRQSDEE